MASLLYNNAKKELCQGLIPWDTSTSIKVLLVNASYNPDANHQFVSSLVSAELSGTGYARTALSGKSVTIDSGTNKVLCDAADLSYTGLNAGTLAAAVIFIDSGADATSTLIAYMDAPDLSSNGSDVAVRWATTGLFSM